MNNLKYYFDCIFLGEVFVRAEVDGHHQFITNYILQVQYSSTVKLYCHGLGRLAWIYKSTTMEDILRTVTKTLAESSNEVKITIKSFNKGFRGFYFCQNIRMATVQRPILLTSCKLFLLAVIFLLSVIW